MTTKTSSVLYVDDDEVEVLRETDDPLSVPSDRLAYTLDYVASLPERSMQIPVWVVRVYPPNTDTSDVVDCTSDDLDSEQAITWAAGIVALQDAELVEQYIRSGYDELGAA